MCIFYMGTHWVYCNIMIETYKRVCTVMPFEVPDLEFIICNLQYGVCWYATYCTPDPHMQG